MIDKSFKSSFKNNHIINSLLLNSNLIPQLGLAHGKMGIAISFYHVADVTEIPVFKAFADELIDDIWEQINFNVGFDFENGLAGIGSGVAYIIEKGYVDASADDVLSEIDNKLKQALMHNKTQGIGLLNGLMGYVVYFHLRIKYATEETSIMKKNSGVLHGFTDNCLTSMLIIVLKKR
jgi:lantibiotic modifying enzyme